MHETSTPPQPPPRSYCRPAPVVWGNILCSSDLPDAGHCRGHLGVEARIGRGRLGKPCNSTIGTVSSKQPVLAKNDEIIGTPGIVIGVPTAWPFFNGGLGGTMRSMRCTTADLQTSVFGCADLGGKLFTLSRWPRAMWWSADRNSKEKSKSGADAFLARFWVRVGVRVEG